MFIRIILCVFLGGYLMIGDIIFIRTKSPISWLIRKLTKSKYSHVAILMSDSGNFLIESDFLKPVKIRKNNYTQFEIVHLNITNEERLKLVSFLVDQTNRKYDYKRIAGIVLNILGLSDNKNLWNDYNKDICSELMVRGLTVLHSEGIPKEIVNAITPADIANILLKKEMICK